MASIDKVAIAFSIAIVAVGVGFAFYAGNAQHNALNIPTVATPTQQPTTQKDTSAEAAAKVKAEDEAKMKAEDEAKMKAEDEAKMKAEDEAKMKAEDEAKMKAEMPAMSSAPQQVSVTIPAGTSSPGCETTNECYIPASVTINVGDTVEWNNVDTAAHTVTAGSSANGPSGAFDSSLLMGGASFAHTFDTAGSYDYFCMVHPWMVGNVQVN